MLYRNWLQGVKPDYRILSECDRSDSSEPCKSMMAPSLLFDPSKYDLIERIPQGSASGLPAANTDETYPLWRL